MHYQPVSSDQTSSQIIAYELIDDNSSNPTIECHDGFVFSELVAGNTGVVSVVSLVQGPDSQTQRNRVSGNCKIT